MRKIKQEQVIFNFIKEELKVQKDDKFSKGFTTNYIAEKLNIKRPNVSSCLNKLTKEGRMKKIDGRPVLYTILDDMEIKNESNENCVFNTIIGNTSLQKCVKQAKAAVLYPPKGLHTLLLGPTGVGKTMFAELMYRFALEKNVLDKDAPFITLNCADYTNNPQLILSQLFGYSKGAFTGANKDHTGLVEKADKGILFLDEIHRLPSEGQELLFYLIDKGEFSPMGSSDKKKVKILIICATTENKDSALLKTFTRRIPVTINIPSLNDRGIKDRLHLIEKFLIEEAYTVKKKISIKTEVMKSILLYQCPGNIGQLKSDIKLICANAFLDTINEGLYNMEIEPIHLPNYIRKGELYLKDYNNQLGSLINGKEKFEFCNEGQIEAISRKQKNIKENFYDTIEKRISELKLRNYTNQDIETIINFEINGHFKNYLNSLDDNIELSKIVGNKTIIYIENLLNIAQRELKRNFSNKVLYGLCLHFESSIKRLKNNKKIVNPNIIEIIENYPKEFEFTRTYIKRIENDLNVIIPLDEIAFITMFLSTDLIEQKLKNNLPKVFIAMHGRSTASSMAETVNTLLGIDTVLAYDMDLNKKSEICYEELKNLINENHNDAGAILLVDMGSLGIFGDLISEELGIKIRVIDLVTTATALEIARNAEIERDIDKICDTVKESIGTYIYSSKKVSRTNINKENVILAICTTGEGSALKIKKLIEDNIRDTNIEIITCAANDIDSIVEIVNKISENQKVIGIVGGLNPKIYGIPFISLSRLILENRYNILSEIIEKENSQIYNENKERLENLEDIKTQVFNALRDNIERIDSLEFRDYFDIFLSNIIKELKYSINQEKLISLIFHMLATTESLLLGKRSKKFKDIERFLIDYSSEISIIKKYLFAIENKYEVEFREDEICYIFSIIKQV